MPYFLLDLQEARAKKNDKKKKAKKKKVQEGPKEWFELKKNTSVYVQVPLQCSHSQPQSLSWSFTICLVVPVQRGIKS